MGLSERWSKDEQTLQLRPDGGQGRYGVRPDGTVQAAAVVDVAAGRAVGVLWADSNGAAGFRPVPGPGAAQASAWAGRVLAALYGEGVPADRVVAAGARFAPAYQLGEPASFESVAEALASLDR
ncbi:hypothetical protein OOJ91_33520 [Micromonospora lupini]|uniref:hypothetical protein n=1 Tax=Micromonospora lupini TaxID=285679 RepID=UPI00224DC68A|nr:hypothetical protein [Micromonospora lupini]MCX5070766.1 hypothetical protein [Micromonospora lupini]